MERRARGLPFPFELIFPCQSENFWFMQRGLILLFNPSTRVFNFHSRPGFDIPMFESCSLISPWLWFGYHQPQGDKMCLINLNSIFKEMMVHEGVWCEESWTLRGSKLFSFKLFHF